MKIGSSLARTAALMLVMGAVSAWASEPAPSSEEACKAAGGQWDPTSGRGHVHGCNPKTSDGGKSCSDSSECEGACVRGHCSEHRYYRGCGIQRGGKVLCVD